MTLNPMMQENVEISIQDIKTNMENHRIEYQFHVDAEIQITQEKQD